MRGESRSDRPLVAHVIDGLGSGGAESLLVTNLRHFAPGRHRHVVVTVFEPGSSTYPSGGFWEPAVAELGVEIHPLRCRDRRELPSLALRFGRYLRSSGVQLVHSHLLYAGLASRVAGIVARVPVITSVHNLSWEPEVLAGYANPRSPKHHVVRYLDGITARFCCDRVVAVGRSVADSAKKRLHVPSEMLRIIYNPVDFSRIDAVDSGARAALLAELGLPPTTALLVNVASVAPQKAQADAVRAMSAVVRRHPNAHLVLIGAKNHAGYLSQIEAAMEETGVRNHVHLLGVRRDVASWLAAADVFVFPSMFEGLPLALAEAAGAGCACVASDIASNREVVTDRHSAILVPSGNPSRLSVGILELLDAPGLRARLGAEAKRTSRERFAPQRSAGELMDLYDEVLARPVRNEERGRDSG